MGGPKTTVTRRALAAFAVALGLLAAGFLGGRPAVGARSGTIGCAPPTAPVASPSLPPPAPATPAVAGFPTEGGDLTVFAAASLTDAFEEIEGTLEAAHPGLSIAFNFAGSPSLVTQLREGAAADVFAAADDAQMGAAQENGSIAGEAIPFVRNRLAIVVPPDNPGRVETAADLGQGGLRLVLAQPEVPAGRYAREAICAMSDDPAAFGGGFVDRVAANVVSEEEDVREVLTKVALGEADAGIVYVSDVAAAGDRVRRIELPDAVNVVATYPIAVVAGGDPALAAAFIAYVLSPEGQATLAKHGFEPVS